MKRILAALLVIAVLCLTGCTTKRSQTPTDTGTDTPQFSMASVTDVSQLKEKVIGALRGTFAADAVVRAQIPILTYEDFATMYAALEKGEISGMALDEPTAISACISYDTLSYIPFENNGNGFKVDNSLADKAIGVKKGSDLAAKINDALKTIPAQTRKELMAQMVMVCAGGAIDASALKSDAPKNPNGVLKVVTECAYEPYNWRAESDANGALPVKNQEGNAYVNGYDVQIAQYVANKLGMGLEIYAADYDAMFSMVEHGDADCLLSGTEPTAERAALVDFTDAYYTANVVIAYMK